MLFTTIRLLIWMAVACVGWQRPQECGTPLHIAFDRSSGTLGTVGGEPVNRSFSMRLTGYKTWAVLTTLIITIIVSGLGLELELGLGLAVVVMRSEVIMETYY